MLSQICFYLGRLYVVCHKEKSFGVQIFEHNNTEENVSQLFKNIFSCETTGTYDVLSCNITSIFSHQTNLRIIILMVQFNCHKISIYVCAALSQKFELIELKSFNYNFDPQCLNIVVVDGPTVVALQNNQVLVTSLMYDTSKTYDLHVHINKELKITLLNCDVYKTCNNVLYSLILQASNTEVKNIHIFVITQKCDSGIFNDEMYKLSVDMFFPSYYETIATAMNTLINNLESIKDDSGSDVISFFLENQSILCTNQQFLIFQNGLLKYCCSILHDDVCRIISIPQLQSSELKNFFIQSNTRGISLMKFNEEADNYECAETWDNALFVCVGDFLKNCGRQILLLNNIECDFWQDDILLLHYPSLNSVVISPNEELSDHIETTLTSLQNRVMYGQASIAEAECRIAEKASIISSILKGFQNQCSTNFLPGQNPNNSLVDIMLSNDQIPQECDESACETKPLALQMCAHWQFVLNNQWFMGWTFRNVSNFCVSNLSASLMIQEAEIEYRQRTFVENSSDFVLQKADKHHSLPGEDMSITLCTEIPTFVCEMFNADCIVMWDIGVPSNPIREALFLDIKGPCQQQSLEISLNVKDIFHNDMFKSSSALHRLMSLRTIQDSIFVEIISNYSSLSKFESRAMKNQQIHPPVILEFEDTKCLFFSDISSPCFGINMAWDQLNCNKIEGEIYARTENEMILFIQWLYNILPSDSAIIPKKCNEQKSTQLKKQLLTAMKNEIDFLRMIAVTSKKSASTSSDSENCIAVDLNLNVDDDSNQQQSTDIRKAVILKEITTDILMNEYLDTNYDDSD